MLTTSSSPWKFKVDAIVSFGFSNGLQTLLPFCVAKLSLKIIDKMLKSEIHLLFKYISVEIFKVKLRFNSLLICVLIVVSFFKMLLILDKCR